MTSPLNRRMVIKELLDAIRAYGGDVALACGDFLNQIEQGKFDAKPAERATPWQRATHLRVAIQSDDRPMPVTRNAGDVTIMRVRGVWLNRRQLHISGENVQSGEQVRITMERER